MGGEWLVYSSVQTGTAAGKEWCGQTKPWADCGPVRLLQSISVDRTRNRVTFTLSFHNSHTSHCVIPIFLVIMEFESVLLCSWHLAQSYWDVLLLLPLPSPLVHACVCETIVKWPTFNQHFPFWVESFTFFQSTCQSDSTVSSCARKYSRTTISSENRIELQN